MKLKKRVITAAVLTSMLAIEIFGSVCVAAEPAFDGGVAEAISETDIFTEEIRGEEDSQQTDFPATSEQEGTARTQTTISGNETEGAEIIHEGIDGVLKWSIDANGHLVIEGEGDYEDRGWLEYRKDIKTAEVNVKGITSTASMFDDCSALTSVDLSKLNTENVKDMSAMFRSCHTLSNVDVSGFDTGNVTSMGWMFEGCLGLTSVDVSGFNTENVMDMSGMFSDCSALTSVNVSGFDTGNVMNMRWMFGCCKSLRSVDVFGFNTENVMDMSYMFTECTALRSVDISGFNTENMTNMSYIFSDCESLVTMRFPANLKIAVKLPWNEDYHWKNEGGKVCTYAFADLSTPMTYTKCKGNVEPEKETVDGGTDGALNWSIDTQGYLVVSGKGDYKNRDWRIYCEGIKTAEVNVMEITSTANMFSNCQSLISIDLSGLDTGKVTDMSCMFSDCYTLSSVDVSGFNTEKVTDMSDMFWGCESLSSVDLSGFNTEKVTHMEGVFWD